MLFQQKWACALQNERAMGEKKIIDQSADMSRRTQSGGLRDLSEGSEVDDGYSIPDPKTNDHDDLANLQTPLVTPGVALTLLMLIPITAGMTFITGEMLATILFCLLMIPILAIGLWIHR